MRLHQMHHTILIRVSASISSEGASQMDGYAQIAGCKNGNCPKVFLDDNRVFVQGTSDATGQFNPPDGEVVVEIPLDVLREAAKEVLA